MIKRWLLVAVLVVTPPGLVQSAGPVKVLRPPPALIAFFGKMARNNPIPCQGTGRPQLVIRYFAALPGRRGGSLLLLVQVPDYQCSSNSFLPVVVDRGGRWRWGQRMSGAPSRLVRGPDGRLWVTALWMIEGTYPMLYHSPDGLVWRNIELPRRPGNPFLFLTRLCFTKTSVRIRIQDHNKQGVHWARPLPISAGRGWRRVESDRHVKRSCVSNQNPAGEWIRRLNNKGSQVIFSRGRLKIAIPLLLTK